VINLNLLENKTLVATVMSYGATLIKPWSEGGHRPPKKYQNGTIKKIDVNIWVITINYKTTFTEYVSPI